MENSVITLNQDNSCYFGENNSRNFFFTISLLRVCSSGYVKISCEEDEFPLENIFLHLGERYTFKNPASDIRAFFLRKFEKKSGKAIFQFIMKD